MHPPMHIGLILASSYAYDRDVLRGIRRYAETRPDWLLTFTVPFRQPARRLRAWKFDGLIASVNAEALAQALAARRRPLVNVSSVLPGLSFPRIGPDNVAIGRLAAGHFLERGLRHFAFVGHPHWVYATEREQGFRSAVEEAGYRVAGYHVTSVQPFDPLGRHWTLERRVHHWLRGLPKPVGLFAADDLFGVQLTEICREAALHVPEEVALLGADNDDLECELARPMLSSVIVPAEQIGREAAALLGRLLEGAKPP